MHRVFAMLTLRGSEPLVRLGCSWMVGPKMGKARIKRNPILLVPEAGIEPAWSFWNRGILRPPRVYDYVRLKATGSLDSTRS